MASILAGALQDLASPKPSVRHDAAAWFQDPDAGRPVSLHHCCDALQLDPRRIGRRGLRWAGLI
jgi:hypothetical protein